LRGSRDFPHFKVQDVLTIVGTNGSNLFAGFDPLAFLEADAFKIAIYRSKSTVGKDDGFTGPRDWKHTRHIPSEYCEHGTRSFGADVHAVVFKRNSRQCGMRLFPKFTGDDASQHGPWQGSSIALKCR